MLVGRGAETAAIRRLLAEARAGRSAALVVRGEPGIGKSTLLEHARESASDFRVLHGAGVESETELAYAGLHQLVRPVLDRADRLPEPQREALRGALGLSHETVEDRFRVSLGVLGLLAEVAEEQPLLCLVDDAQWLDQASADALRFTARRLDAEPIALLFATRDDPVATFLAPGLPELRPSHLPPDDARALVLERLEGEVASSALDWLVKHAHGNPLALVELPSVLTRDQIAGRDLLQDTVPPSTSVEQAYLARVERLPAATRAVLLVAACEETGDRDTVAGAAAELGLAVGELAAAEAEGLITVDRDRVRFGHPLVRSAVYRAEPFTQRERVHRALAAVLATPADADRRAWHRAAAAGGRDDGIADELERTADRAHARGGPGAAAVALERAAELTSEPAARGRRLALAARESWRAGRAEHAAALLDLATPLVLDPSLRADLAHLRGLIAFRCGSLVEAAEILVAGAETIAAADPGRARAMLLDAGSVSAKLGDPTRLAGIVRDASALPRSPDELEAIRMDLLVGVGGLVEGTTAHVPLIREAIAQAHRFDHPALLSWAAMGAAAIGDEATELGHLRHAVTVARESRAVDTLVYVLETVVNAAMLAGRYDIQLEASEGLALAVDAGLPNPATAHRAALAWVAGLRGRADECRSFAEQAIDSARANRLADAYSAAEWALALLDLGAGRPEDSATRLTALGAAPLGLGHPLLVLTSTPDLVEACIRAGRAGEAREALSRFEAFAQPKAPAWARALALRCHGLVSEGEEADHSFLRALDLHAEAGRPFDRARTQLAYGEFLRRERRRIDARGHLRSALAAFEELRADPWAERTRTELRATGETARKRDPSSRDELTPQELQIALLVSEGHSNREVAAQLFLSPRTVEYHLRKVFAKLGIASRAELIRDGIPSGGRGLSGP